MTPAKFEELLAVLYFILASQLTGRMRQFVFGLGMSCIVLSIILTIQSRQ